MLYLPYDVIPILTYFVVFPTLSSMYNDPPESPWHVSLPPARSPAHLR